MAEFLDSELSPELDSFSPEIPQVNEKEKKSVAADVTAMETINSDSPPSQDYWGIVMDMATQMDVNAMKQSAAERELSLDQEAVMEMMEKSLYDTTIDTERAVQNVDSLAQINQNIENEKNDKAAFERAFSNRFGLDEIVNEEETFRNYAGNSIRKLMDEADWVDWTREVGGSFFIIDKTKDLSDFLDSSVFNTFDSFEGFLNRFYKASPRDRIALWDDIVERAKESHENPVAAASFLSLLLDPNAVDKAKEEGVWDAVDIASFAAVPVVAVHAASKARNTAKKISDLGNPGDSAAVVSKAMEDPEAADAINMTQQDIAATINPFKMEEYMPNSIDGISEELIASIEGNVAAVTGEIGEVKGILNSWKEGKLLQGEFLSEEARKAATEAAVTRGLQRQRELGEAAFSRYGVKYENIRVGRSSPEGVEILYDVEGETFSFKELFTIDDETGSFRNIELNPVTSKFFSPIQMFGENDFLVKTSTRLMDQNAVIFNSMQRAHKKAIDPIKWNKKSQDKVDEVLRKGDDWDIEDGRVFSPQELKDGMADGRTIPKLNDNEITSYYSLRKLLDEAHDFVNFTELRKKQVSGLKEITVRGDDFIEGIESFHAKPLMTIDEALEYFSGTRKTLVKGKKEDIKAFARPRVYDSEMNGGKGGTRRLTKTELEDLYADGYKISRLDETTELAATDVDYVINRIEDIGELSYNQVNKRTGYLPKFYKNANYIVYRINKEGVRQADRIFDNVTDADAYQRKMEMDDPDYTYLRKADRELTHAEWEQELVHAYGGPFKGARSRHEILYGIDGDVPTRMDAYESISRNLRYISTITPINDWRMSVQKMWLNTAQKIADKEGLKTILDSPSDFWSDIKLPQHDPKRVGLEKLRDYLADQLRIPTRDERMFDSMVRNTAEWMEKGLLDKDFKIPFLGEVNPRKSLMNLQHVDPFSMARTATFHPLLGFFNISQLLVQAQGAAIAMATNPTAAPKRLAEYNFLRSVIHLNKRSPDLGKVRMAFAKAAGIPKEEAQEIAEQFLKTGLMDSIHLSADMGAAMSSGVSSLRALKTISDKGLVFYREGELFSRGYSFLQARANWKAANKGKRIDDNALKEIIDETYRLTMNMSRANRAEWQKGALSIPTQFTQVYWKFIGNLTGRKWSSEEKAKILAFQLGVFGTAGIPAVDYLTNGAANLAGLEPGDIDDKYLNMINNGLQGAVAKMTGIDNEFAARMAYLGNNDNIITKMFDNETPMTEAMFGAFGSVVGRSKDAVQRLVPLVANPFKEGTELTLHDLSVGLDGIASITSSWSNIQKARAIVNTGRVFSGKGTEIAEKDYNWQTLMMKSLGFELKDVVEHYQRKEFIQSSKKARQAATEDIITLWHKYLANVQDENAEQAAANFMSMQRTIITMHGLSPRDWQIVKKTLSEKLIGQKDERTKIIAKNIDEIWRGGDRAVWGENPEPLKPLE